MSRGFRNLNNYDRAKEGGEMEFVARVFDPASDYWEVLKGRVIGAEEFDSTGRVRGRCKPR